MDISMLIATRHNAARLEDMFRNVKQFTKYQDKFEILIKIDRNDTELLRYYDSGRWREFKLNINFLITDQNGGYFNLGPAYNQLLLAADPSSFWICIGNDGLRFATQNWDEKLMSYKSRFPDEIAYIRTSLHRHVKYNNDILRMLMQPDNFPFYSRPLIHLMEGVGDYWSSDTWFGPIVGLLAERYGHDRSIIWEGDLFTPDSLMWSAKPREAQIRIMNAFLRMNQPDYIKYSFDRIAKKIADHINNYKKVVI
jgi:hypothetical protein